MKFNYQAKDKNGQTQVGVVEASSKETALKILSRNGLYITMLEADKAKAIYSKRIEFFDRISLRDVMLFSRQLSIMFRSRVSLVEALRTLASQVKNESFKEKILGISEDVEAGTAFSDALGKHPKVFSVFYVNMVKSGEASGTLSGVLDYLAEHMEREYHLTSKLRGALIYPAFIVFVSFAVLFLMMFFVIPNLSKVLEETGQELPVVTQVVLAFASVIKSFWWLLFLLIGGAATIIFRWARTEKGKRFFNVWFLKIPLLAPFLRMIYLSRFAENLSTLISGGLPIVQSLDITSKIVGNDVYKDIIQEAKEGVRKGGRISQILQKYPSEFPPVFTQMIFVGEQSGTLDKTLLNVVEFYQKEVDRTVDTFLSILEPAFVVVLGLVVGGLMASVLLPLYQLTSF